MIETEEQRIRRVDEAQAAFDRNTDIGKMHAAQIQTFASDAMKAPALVSAGGIAAALGFYSANYQRLAAMDGGLDMFNNILFWLFLSLLFTVLAPMMAYFSQLFYAQSVEKRRLNLDLPYVSPTRISLRYEKFGDISRFSCYFLLISSIISLLFGGSSFLKIVH